MHLASQSPASVAGGSARAPARPRGGQVLGRVACRRLARYCQWLFVPHLPAYWGAHSKFPRLPW
eukprot:scaffold125739_cov100-Phaeocystis_antarctica.AAC.2